MAAAARHREGRPARGRARRGGGAGRGPDGRGRPPGLRPRGGRRRRGKPRAPPLPRPAAEGAPDDGAGLLRPRRRADARPLHAAPLGLPLDVPAARPRGRRDLRSARGGAHARPRGAARARGRAHDAGPARPRGRALRPHDPLSRGRAGHPGSSGRRLRARGRRRGAGRPDHRRGHLLRAALRRAPRRDASRRGLPGALPRARPRRLRPRPAEGGRAAAPLLRPRLRGAHGALRGAQPARCGTCSATSCSAGRATWG